MRDRKSHGPTGIPILTLPIGPRGRHLLDLKFVGGAFGTRK
jgi:hypothetical protein